MTLELPAHIQEKTTAETHTDHTNAIPCSRPSATPTSQRPHNSGCSIAVPKTRRARHPRLGQHLPAHHRAGNDQTAAAHRSFLTTAQAPAASTPAGQERTRTGITQPYVQ
jgi:hypothetical protein